MKIGPRALLAVELHLLVGAAVVVGGCGQVADQGSGIEMEDGSLRGELAVYVSDTLDGQSETHYALRSALGVERPLLFDTAVDLAPGTQVKVWGTSSPDGLRVTTFEQVGAPAIEETSSALINGTAFAPRTFAFVLVNVGGTVNTDAATVSGLMMTNPTSIRNYYLNDSYGTQDISAQVFGPINYTFPATCANADTSALASALRPMIPGTFNHYLWYLGTRQTQCAWAGLASVGTAQTPSRDTWYNASTGCVVLVQEPGHNFGMQHSSSLTCPGASFADDPNTCTTSEYGDIYDPMGGGCRHMNAWQKSYQGWFSGCNGVAITSSGTFTLLPFENRCDGAQFLKVKAAKSRTFNRPAAGGGGATTDTMGFYYVELRTPVDFDGTLGNRTALAPQVLIHAGDDVHTRTQRGVHTYLLDMNPATTGANAFTDAALKVGSTFTDPAGGVSITATAVSATQATITVDITDGTGAATCLDGTTFASPGPGPESCGAGTGAGGAIGTGGTGVITGSGGATGTGGRGGAAGGTGGRTGTGGGTGTGGLIGGSGGSTASGSGGGSVLGTGGAIGATPDAGPAGGPGASAKPDVSSGCSCAIEGGSPLWSGSLVGLGAIFLFGARRRRRR